MPSKFQFLTPENLVETFRSSQQYTESLTGNFFEYERIARNKPHASIPKEYPKTTDGTTASIIRKTPHRIIQQLPTGKVKSIKEDWLSIVAEFIYYNKIIPNANEGYALLQKCWNVVERFLTFGFCPTYAPFTEHHGYFCTDLRLPYWGDIFLQPGKLSDEDSNFIFMRSWWQTKDIESLIASQQGLKNPTWDVGALEAVKKIESTKDEKAKTPIEREKSINTKGGVELITGFQRGVGAKFYTFHVQSTGTGDKTTYSGTIVRTKTNKDPRGELPISFAYGDIDGSNPLGRSVIDLVGGLQNLMDGEMQMYQYNRALQLNPPLIKRGSWNKNKIKFAPNTIIDMGSGDPNTNSIEALKIDTTALAQFPQNYGLMKSQMLNLLASPDTSVSADIGNPGFSKTPQGVEASRANLSVDDNYVRKQFEAWFERWSETAINLYFAEREGIEELQLDDETAETLRALDDFDPSQLSDDNKIRINYSTATAALEFEVDASSSQLENNPAQQQIAKDLLDTVMKYPMLNSSWGGAIDVDALARKIVTTSGVSNPDTIAPEPTQAQKQAKLQSKQQPNGFSPMFDKPKLDIRYPDLPAAAQLQLLGLAGIQVSMEDVMQGPPLDQNIDRNDASTGGTQPDPQQQSDLEHQKATTVTPDHVLKVDQQVHQQQMDKAKLQLEAEKVQQQGQQQALQTQLQAKQADQSHELAVKQANKPQPSAKPKAKAK
jgi:hypothetical protein